MYSISSTQYSGLDVTRDLGEHLVPSLGDNLRALPHCAGNHACLDSVMMTMMMNMVKMMVVMMSATMGI